jgi:hypothetical protein
VKLPPSIRRVASAVVPHALRVSAVLALAALPAAAQDDRFIKLDLNSRFAIEAMIDSAVMLGLPDAPLKSRAYQGISKKAANGKIVEAVRTKFQHLKTALSVLGPVGDQELDAASAVLDAGAKPTQLAAFRPRQKGRSDLDAFAVWADLLYRGVPGEEASSAITKLWEDGADAAVFRRLWNGVQEDISQGLNPGAALRARIRETPVRQPARPGTPPEG